MSNLLEFRECRRRASHAWSALAMIGVLVVVPPLQAEEGTCQPSTPEELASELGVAEASMRAKPSRAYRRIKHVEEALLCVSAVVDRAFLGDVYRAKGMALLYLGNERAAEKAFRQAGILDPESDCKKAMARYGTRGRARQGVGLCEAAQANARGRMLDVRLEGLRGSATLYRDGEEAEQGEDYVSSTLSAGKHLLQYKEEAGGFSTRWLVVPAPEDPTRTVVWLNLKKLGLAPYIEEVVETGTLRIEGLPPRAQVYLDGRLRRDLPVLRNVEVGERHLMIRTPDGTVMGAAVKVEADKETVYDVASIAAARARGSTGGFDVRTVASYGALGVGALSAAASALLMVAASNAYAEAEDAYEVYLKAEYGADFDTLYEAVESKREEAHRASVFSAVLGGAAVAAVGAGTYLLVGGEGGGFARVAPYLFPLGGRRTREAGVAVGLRVRF